MDDGFGLVQLDSADDQKKKKETPVKMAVSDGLVALYCCFFLLEMSVRNFALLFGYALSYLFSL